VLQCAGAKTATCLSAPQVTALKAAFAGPKNSANQPLYHPWPWDPGIAAAGWRAWTLGTSTTSTSNALYTLLMEPTIGYEFVTPPDTTIRLSTFNFDTDPPRMDAYDSIYGNWRDTTLAGFRQRGGKLMIFHGMADPIFSATESQRWYEQLTTNNGGAANTQAFARLFQIPGMTHCSGGPATDAWDGLTALVDWVEKGQAPARVLARGTTALPNVSRPLCPYPQHARYTGPNPNDAASFTCQ
jgi:feruloyl esterase